MTEQLASSSLRISRVQSSDLETSRHLPLTTSTMSGTSMSASQITHRSSCSGPDNYPLLESAISLPLGGLNSLNIGSELKNPSLVHKWTCGQSIVCVAASPKHKLLFCGTQDSYITVFDLETFQMKQQIRAHPDGSVLCLLLSDDENTLFSGGSDSLVKVWNVETLQETHTIYSVLDIGDIFSIAWIESTQTVFIGAQNASISYIHLNTTETQDASAMPSLRFDKFFDSKGPGGNLNPTQQAKRLVVNNSSRLIEVSTSNIISYAHNGYIYAMETIKFSSEEEKSLYSNFSHQYNDILISAGGDGLVKLWGIPAVNSDSYNSIELKQLAVLDNDDSVLSITRVDSYLYCGLTEGQVKVWDLSTLQQIKTYESDEGDTVSLALYGDCLFKGTNSGVTKWKFKGELKTDWVAHDGYALAVKTMSMGDSQYLITAGIDHSLALWNIDCLKVATSPDVKNNGAEPSMVSDSVFTDDRMLKELEKLVSYKTVSKKPEIYIDESRACANYLRYLLKSLGASSSALLPVENGNPVVYACFKANKKTDGNNIVAPRVLWYGHYDVIEVKNTGDSQWSTDPFKMSAVNGYLYGRGVTDNKGPLIAAISAVSELYQESDLSSDIVFLIEGEEECGSFGFQDVVQANKSIIGNIDWIFLSNSYWLNDEIPALNYGLRGVVSAKVEVWSDKPDRHSGVDGGISREPTIDLIHILSTLNDKDGKVKLPNFYDAVMPLKQAEKALYEQIINRTNIKLSIDELMAKWRFPSLTIHKVNVSGPGNSTIIPQVATANLSLRIVPNQDMNVIKQTLHDYLTSQFAELHTENHLNIKILDGAEPWLGDPNNKAYSLLFENVSKEWGIEPILIREGGSIPSIRFLEKAFDAPAAHLPCGQSSDNAHLDNERLRVSNLFKTKAILKGTFNRLSDI